MRIGIDCRLWNQSGVGRYTRNLIEQLQLIDKNNEYVLFAGRDIESQIVKQIQGDNFRVVIAGIHWHSLEEQVRFPGILNKENLDLVHFPYFSVPVFYKKPFIVTIHDLIIDHFPTGEASTLLPFTYKSKRLGYKFIIKKAAKKAKKIITVSNSTKKEIVDHLKVDPDKITVTYEGTMKMSNIKYPMSNIQLKNKDYFLYVGNAYPHKNLERLIEAFNRLCRPELVSRSHLKGKKDSSPAKLDQNDTKLVLVGREDFFYKRLKDKVEKLGLEGSIIFKGEVDDDKLQNLYQNAKALIMPSLMEGFGLPIIEAMANKCLVLCSDIPSFKEIALSCAIYFDPSSSCDIAEKMREICSNDLNHDIKYKDKIQKGFERSKEFSWEKMAKETLRVYNSAK